MGLDIFKIMVPFYRRVEEARTVLDAMARHGLARGEDGLEVYVMCEISNNVTSMDAGAKRNGRACGICGQAPSDFPEIAEHLVRAGTDSISLSPHSLLSTMLRVVEPEAEHGRAAG